MNITVKETTQSDLENIVSLWNNGVVMFYYGFPNGKGVKTSQLEQWLKETDEQKPLKKHYSIYEEKLGYCGETCYEVVHDELAYVDIKLLPYAQGKGIERYAFKYAIHAVFDNNLATRAYVEPNNQNVAAFKLCNSLGFQKVQKPEFLQPKGNMYTYMEVTKDSLID